jgi:spore maturation protein CgeB
MKVLLVCMEYDYGEPSRGHSYEYYNFFLSLRSLGHDVTIFDYMAEIKKIGKMEMNKKLLNIVTQSPPDLAFFSLYTDQLDPEIVNKLRNYTKTLCFFHDDTWREEYSLFWARNFDYFTTADIYGERRYEAQGLSNSIHFPFGCNGSVYRRMELPKRYDVSFVGGWSPYRHWLIERVRKAGFSVHAVGYRWPAGKVDLDEMVKVYNESRINLNLSNSANWDARYLLSSPRALVNRIRSTKTIEQIKARPFEVNGCGAFQLSYYVEGLETYYQIGKEIGIYLDPDDLLTKIKLYLADETLRQTIAQAGYLRTLSDHTFERRFKKIFARMGLSDG